MILTCPSCATRYFADLSGLGDGARAVRCAACGHVWKAKAAESGPKPTPDKDPEPDSLPEMVDAGDEALAPPTRPRAPRFRFDARAKGAVSWGAAAAVLLAAVGASYVFRVEIVRVWPKAASAYAAVGVTATASGLVLENVAADRVVENGAPVLRVTADIRNPTGVVRPTPFVRVTFTDVDGREVLFQDVAPPVAELAPRARAPFEAMITDPPIDAVNMEVLFTDRPVSAADVEDASAPEHADAADDPHADG